MFVVPQDRLNMMLPSLLSTAVVMHGTRFSLTAVSKAWFSRAVVSIPKPLWPLLEFFLPREGICESKCSK